MARAELDVGELLLKLIARETGEISKVDYHPQKPTQEPISILKVFHFHSFRFTAFPDHLEFLSMDTSQALVNHTEPIIAYFYPVI